MEFFIVLSLCILIPRIAIGYWANIALYKRATKEIEKIRALKLDNERHLSFIASAGTVSMTAVILITFCFGIIGRIVTYKA